MLMSTMTPDMVRRFWTLVDEISRPDLVLQKDEALIAQIRRACQQKYPLSNVDSHDLDDYISTRLPLIRDLVLE